MLRDKKSEGEFYTLNAVHNFNHDYRVIDDEFFFISPINFENQTHKITRKRALHARMSHSTVCNTTVSTKKTRRTLMK